MTSPVIRPARPEDSETLRALTLRAKAHWGYPADYLAAWTAALDVGPDFLRRSVSFVAERGGAIAGYYSLIAEDAPVRGTGFTAEAGWWLDNLFVNPPHMGTGLGALLYRHAAARALALGAARFYLISDAKAAGFYARMGAVRLGEMPSMVPWVTLPVYMHTLEGATSAAHG